ncbi:MAG: ribonuclease P protein component [bacterium]|nr:ribonuclease P protein component [bacterium]
MTDSPACGSVHKGGSSKAPPLLFSPFRLPVKAFEALFTTGQSVANGAMVLRWVKVPTDRTRVGVIAAKRTFHLAVQRSRARRLMREAFRLERLQLQEGIDIVLLGRRKLLTMSCDEVRKALLQLAARARILRKS